MAWTKLQYSREEVNRAAKAMVAYDANPEYEAEQAIARIEALPVINNWRSSHSFPLNTFRVNLNRTARRVDPDCLLAQRIKRLSSISAKLQRFPSMKYTQMQDIGGCRAVLKSVEHVSKLVESYRKSGMKHKLEAVDDYIASPKASGYRGVHLVFRYFSDKRSDYNGLKIEMQLRSSYQHAWATAVETVGTFLHQALKSSLGEEEWLRFFILMSAAIAIKENTPLVPGAPVNRNDLYAELAQYAETLDVINRLASYGNALQVMEQPVDEEDAAYFLLKIDPAKQQLTIKGFKRNEIDDAAAEYIDVEKSIEKSESTDAVLVSVDSVISLRRAYPNYFADTQSFLNLVREAVRKA